MTNIVPLNTRVFCCIFNGGGHLFLTTCPWSLLTWTHTHHTESSVEPVLSARSGIWVTRNKQCLCVCYFLFVPQWTGAKEGRRRVGEREWGPRPGKEAPGLRVFIPGLPTPGAEVPGAAAQNPVQMPEKKRMPGSHQWGLWGRLRGAPLCLGEVGVALMEMCRKFTPPKNLKRSGVVVATAGVTSAVGGAQAAMFECTDVWNDV